MSGAYEDLSDAVGQLDRCEKAGPIARRLFHNFTWFFATPAPDRVADRVCERSERTSNSSLSHAASGTNVTHVCCLSAALSHRDCKAHVRPETINKWWRGAQPVR